MSSSPSSDVGAPASSACPSCGGAGGGPTGRVGGAWDTEDYVCPRCRGTGVVSAEELAMALEAAKKADAARARLRPARPSVVKAAPPPAPAHDAQPKKRAQ